MFLRTGIKALGLASVAVLLTLLTQVGGVLLIGSWLAARALPWRRGRVRTTVVVFVCAYAVASAFVVPSVAPLLGRVALPCGVFSDPGVRPRSLLYCVLNRHYVTANLYAALAALGDDMAARHPGAEVVYLDASFPFIDGFPLLPHLSHDGGRQVDLAFYYAADDGTASAMITPSPIGYWGFEQPRPGDYRPCQSVSGPLRWDLDWLQPVLPERSLHVPANQTLMQWLARDPHGFGITRVFLEPHLQTRFGVTGGRIGFQGCHAARHDDHVHVTVSR